MTTPLKEPWDPTLDPFKEEAKEYPPIEVTVFDGPLLEPIFREHMQEGTIAVQDQHIGGLLPRDNVFNFVDALLKNGSPKARSMARHLVMTIAYERFMEAPK